MNRRTLAPLALLTLALAIPSTASAAVRCVPSAEPGCDVGHTTIDDAVTAATNGDEIRIAAGVYDELITTDKRLHFVGAGPGTLDSDSGATVIAPTAGTALTLQKGGSVRFLRAIGSDGLIGGNGLILSPTDGNYSYDIEDVIALAGETSNIGGGSNGLRIVGADTNKVVDLDVTGSTFRGASAATTPGEGVRVFGPGATATFSRTRLLPAEDESLAVGMAAGSGAEVALIETTVRGSRTAARFAGGDLEVRRSRLEGDGGVSGPGSGLHVTSGGLGVPTSATVVNSLIASSPGNAAIDSTALLAQTASGGGDISLALRGSTIAGGGEDPDTAVLALDSDAGAPEVNVDLRNSVAVLADGGDADDAELHADRGTITASHSSFNSVATENGGTVPAVGSGSNVAGDPLLGGDYLPGESSPLVDAGDPGIVSDGELDLAGNSRSLDGNGNCESAPDIGAFERPSACDPPPTPVEPPNVRPVLSKVVLARKAFTARKPRRKGRRRGTAFRFALSEPARVRIAFFRRAAGRVIGRKGKRRCVRPTRRNRTRPRCRRWARAGAINRRGRAGRNRIRFSGVIRRHPPRRGRRALRPGRYLAVFVAIDAEGARSQRRKVTFRVLRP